MVYLFQDWDALKDKLKNKFLFIFLDFDGTIVPIADTPDKVTLPEEVRALLRGITNSRQARLAFISGRRIEDIKNKIGLKNAIYSGNHGLQIEGPKIKFEPVVSPGFRKVLEKIKEDLKAKTSFLKGILIEDKGLSLSLHYRLVDEKQISKVKTIFHETVIQPLVKNKIKVKYGKMMLEVRTPVDWDKGKVVLWLLARQVFVSKAMPVLPIYIGDDLTDEDAFKALNKKGLTIFVGEPKESYAQYYLRSPGEVVNFMKRLSLILSP